MSEDMLGLGMSSEQLEKKKLRLCSELKSLLYLRRQKMTVRELKEMLNTVPDDFNVNIGVRKRIPKNQINQTYPYPFKNEILDAEPGDIGYSDKVFRIDCEIKEI